MSRRSSGGENVFAGVIIFLVVAAIVLGGMLIGGCQRRFRIDSCVDRGGQAITHTFFSGHWVDVECLEPRAK